MKMAVPKRTAIWQYVSRLPYGSTFRDCHRGVPKWQKSIGFYSKNCKIEGGVSRRFPGVQKSGIPQGEAAARPGALPSLRLPPYLNINLKLDFSLPSYMQRPSTLKVASRHP